MNRGGEAMTGIAKVGPVVRVARVISAISVLAVTITVPILAASVQAARQTVFVNCLPSGAGTSSVPFAREQHPTQCVLQGEPETSANRTGFRRAHWSYWGKSGPVAYARITNPNASQGGPRSYAGEVALSRIRSGCQGASYYTRAKVTIGTDQPYVLHLSAGCKTSP
jgi:hypothetical protein